MKIKNILLASFAMASSIMNAQEEIIKESELPASAVTFLATNFKNNPVRTVVKDTDMRKVTFEVKLNDGTEVEFNQKGEWKEVDGDKKPIPTAFIPKTILDYVKTKYPNEQITHIDKGLRDYDVDLTNGLDLEFDLNGKFLRIDK
ncbi:PepSY-like domain-containing protein [Flavobacterium sp. PLA-1-15]|uniref:PepSY-like domain-containing protein n=1 Tax=Flavobacterium sp. PLA-1-15 TaxID=3380533 RepID=UPI003B76EDFF